MAERFVSADVELAKGEFQLKFRANVPAEPAPLRRMLPLVQAIADTLSNGAERAAAEQGQPISCKAGCGACCRQLVPIGEVEARNLANVVQAMPEPRRLGVRARFTNARQRLEEAGLLQPLLHPEEWTQETVNQLGKAYFHLGIACPFLENESCSIYRDRPIICREFLVTSPPENCAKLIPGTVRRIKLPLHLTKAVASVMPESGRSLLPVPLVLALGWAAEHPDFGPQRTGPEWLGEILERLRSEEEDVLQPESPEPG
jgi:Fe-S-cluster containining protein